ncbi:MAG: YdbC family protein [Tuberibacillus sp.]
MPEFKFEVLKSFGTISETENGWKKELTIVSWNDREPKYDIRSWSPQKDRMGRGITLTKEELLSLKNLLNQVSLVNEPSHLAQISG